MKVLFVAGFGPIVSAMQESAAFYRESLGLSFQEEGVTTFFPPIFPAKGLVRPRTGLNKANSPVAWQQRRQYSRPFPLKK